MSRGRWCSPEEVIDVTRRLKAGESPDEIARAIGRPISTVQAMRRRAGLLRRTGPRFRIDRRRVHDLKRAGKSHAAIAELVGCSMSAVSQILKLPAKMPDPVGAPRPAPQRPIRHSQAPSPKPAASGLRYRCICGGIRLTPPTGICSHQASA